jgi:hypothetical protein
MHYVSPSNTIKVIKIIKIVTVINRNNMCVQGFHYNCYKYYLQIYFLCFSKVVIASSPV